MMAAITAAELGASVTVFDKNPRPGRKLMITGKGRCNVTNACTSDEVIKNVVTNPKFLYTAVNAFPPEAVMAFFESCGVLLKTERGRRVFPLSDKAVDIVDALQRRMRKAGCRYINERIVQLRCENGRISEVVGEKNVYGFDKVILCTGGFSYPLTGSTGDGVRMAQHLNHSIKEPHPSLVPIETVERDCAAMQGLSLKNIGIQIEDTPSGKTIFEDFGEMMFTHFGLTGPVILSASAHMQNAAKGKYRIRIDLKPALDFKKLDERLLSDFQKYKNKDFSNSLGDLLPTKMIGPFVARTRIDPRKKVNEISREERMGIADLLKNYSFTFKSFRPIEEAIITSGGVDVREINPRTMESKRIQGLYFAGELIDVDAYTGGYNLQIAFCTGYLAGQCAASE